MTARPTSSERSWARLARSTTSTQPVSPKPFTPAPRASGRAQRKPWPLLARPQQSPHLEMAHREGRVLEDPRQLVLHHLRGTDPGAAIDDQFFLHGTGVRHVGLASGRRAI